MHGRFSDDWFVGGSGIRQNICHPIFVVDNSVKISKMSIAAIQADCKRAMQSLMSMSNDELDSFFNDPERQDVLLADMDQVVERSFV